MKVDCHLHTYLCGHAEGHPLEYVRMAALRKIDLITFTCHIPMKEPDFGGAETRMGFRDLPAYCDMVEAARINGQSLGVEVCCGIEAEIFPEASVIENMATTLRRFPFDFVTGALHFELPCYRRWLYEHEIQDKDEVIETYFTHLCHAIRSGLYHAISHPDRIMEYGPNARSNNILTHEFSIKRLLKTAAEYNVCIEINTNEGKSDAYHLPCFLEWALEAGVKLIIGSDAHAPRFVGEGIDQVRQKLRDYGPMKLYYYRKGIPYSFAHED